MSAGAIVALAGVVALLAGLALYERGRSGSREIGLVAVLIAAASAGRVLFAAVPGAQPVTAIAIIAGIALGPRAGIAVGAGSALVSNAFLGQGPWTPWQMLLWGLAGLAGGLLAPALRRSRGALVALGVTVSLVFGALMDVWQLSAFGPALTVTAFAAVHVRAIPFDLAHAIATAAILGLAGPSLIALVDRSAVRVRGRWITAPEPES
ncbi:MAG: ECF transporter S component [Actinobacteria bacterium]|nr:ECF transporter S component [Actinomycetota bacterium]